MFFFFYTKSPKVISNSFYNIAVPNFEPLALSIIRLRGWTRVRGVKSRWRRFPYIPKPLFTNNCLLFFMSCAGGCPSFFLSGARADAFSRSLVGMRFYFGRLKRLLAFFISQRRWLGFYCLLLRHLSVGCRVLYASAVSSGRTSWVYYTRVTLGTFMARFRNIARFYSWLYRYVPKKRVLRRSRFFRRLATGLLSLVATRRSMARGALFSTVFATLPYFVVAKRHFGTYKKFRKRRRNGQKIFSVRVIRRILRKRRRFLLTSAQRRVSTRLNVWLLKRVWRVIRYNKYSGFRSRRPQPTGIFNYSYRHLLVSDFQQFGIVIAQPNFYLFIYVLSNPYFWSVLQQSLNAGYRYK